MTGERTMNILLTSVGRRTYLVNYFKEALAGKGKVFVSNSSAMSPAFLAADQSVVTPKIYDENYIEFLLDYCKENDISAIISLFDIDLPVLACNKAKFEDIGTKVIVSDYPVVNVCNDKWEMYNFLKKNGFAQPITHIQIEKVLQDIGGGKMVYPVMIKPRWGMGSIAVYEAENEQELISFYNKCQRDIEKTYLKYESAQAIGESVLIQQKVAGQEYGLDIINDLKQNYVHTVVKKKLAMRAGETDCAETVCDEKLADFGAKVSTCMRHIANLDVDVICKDGNCYILDMNARFGGGYPFSHLAGVNLPLAIVKWLEGKTVKFDILQEKYGVVCHKDIDMVKLDGLRE